MTGGVVMKSNSERRRKTKPWIGEHWKNMAYLSANKLQGNYLLQDHLPFLCQDVQHV
jgi:hypothetical protein